MPQLQQIRLGPDRRRMAIAESVAGAGKTIGQGIIGAAEAGERKTQADITNARLQQQQDDKALKDLIEIGRLSEGKIDRAGFRAMGRARFGQEKWDGELEAIFISALEGQGREKGTGKAELAVWERTLKQVVSSLDTRKYKPKTADKDTTRDEDAIADKAKTLGMPNYWNMLSDHLFKMVDEGASLNTLVKGAKQMHDRAVVAGFFRFGQKPDEEETRKQLKSIVESRKEIEATTVDTDPQISAGILDAGELQARGRIPQRRQPGRGADELSLEVSGAQSLRGALQGMNPDIPQRANGGFFAGAGGQGVPQAQPNALAQGVSGVPTAPQPLMPAMTKQDAIAQIRNSGVLSPQDLQEFDAVIATGNPDLINKALSLAFKQVSPMTTLNASLMPRRR